MIKKITLITLPMLLTLMIVPLEIPKVAITFGVGDTLAKSIVNYILAASDLVSLVSLIGIVFGVGGFSLAAVQTVRYLAKKSFGKAVAW
ncbi:circular bacteriocin, circularin A/uberolysin family [Enterococcus faecalis]|uniref:circular bacteriocin, circularin A/uberolysin family n=1 Tax=Enterococcus faecalis TaxID=1351 RepID=UPI0025B10567|nr:circular bacteriocin, circularin A/uberolysin family [Enterococcus faecalis]MDN3202162.1 circular bacteriocin, circularin A/uberolysin family [Enterococcus faecalis]